MFEDMVSGAGGKDMDDAEEEEIPDDVTTQDLKEYSKKLEKGFLESD